MLETISQLKQSIDSREREQKKYKQSDDPTKFDSEKARIDLEKQLLDDVQCARDKELAEKNIKKKKEMESKPKPDPKMNKGGFKMV